MSSRQRWTKAELATLCNGWEQYHDRAERYVIIASMLPGRTPAAVQLKAQSMGMKVAHGGTLTLAAVERYLGKTQNLLTSWVSSGMLPVQKHRSNRPYQITLDELWAWMEDQKTWHLWEPETIEDCAVREHFTELRRDWLSAKEAALELGLESDTVPALIRRGRLAGVIYERAVWVHRRELEAYRLRNSDDLVALVADLRGRVVRLEQMLERKGILTVNYPARGRYAYNGAER